MNRYVKYLCLIATASMVIAVNAPPAEAEVPIGSIAAAVFPNEGNVNCSDYAGNKTILSMDTSKAVWGVKSYLTGPEDPVDNDTDTTETSEQAHYNITSDGLTANFGVDTDAAINYAVLKSGTDVAVYIYNSGGVGADNGMQIIRNGTAEPISALSLCYGLPGQSMAEEDLPDCSSIGITVNSSLKNVIIGRFESGADTNGQNLHATLCAANFTSDTTDPDYHPPFHRCDPNLPYNSEYACYNNNSTANHEPPPYVQFGGDTDSIGGSAGFFTSTWP